RDWLRRKLLRCGEMGGGNEWGEWECRLERRVLTAFLGEDGGDDGGDWWKRRRSEMKRV
ncbi:hypothetical protein L195_g035589, partial [Trifolium pratense]